MKTVLLIEDAPFWQEDLRSQLGHQGFIVLVAGSLTKAWRLFQEADPKPDAIICDGFVPLGPSNEFTKADTIELIRRIRATSYTGPMFATSDYEDFRRQQIEAGCNHACTKDVVTASLVEALAA